MSERSCPFCAPDPSRVFHEGNTAFAIWDAYPVTDGHALVVLRRHAPSWFDATAPERMEMLALIDQARAEIDLKHDPDGYTIGVNVGEPAGQTIPHLHVHVIPRYTGDVPDPTGGVRNVIPGRGNYLRAVPTAPDSRTSSQSEHDSPLAQGGKHDPLLARLVELMDEAQEVDIVAAFTLQTGVALIADHLQDVLDRGGRVRVLTGDYLQITEPEALLRLLDLEGDFQLRVFESGGTSFHPKAYIVGRTQSSGAAFVGSSNLSRSALQTGVEWNYRVVSEEDGAGFRNITHGFERLWNDTRAVPVDVEWVRRYQSRRPSRPIVDTAIAPEPVAPVVPHEIQEEALAALAATREEGNSAGLVVLATGLGKTWLSAFDSRGAEFKRVLFVAHREEILRQAMRTFRQIRPTAILGHYTGTEKSPDANVLFASIQTLSRVRHLQVFAPGDFDYVIVDEFHHAAARTYRRLINYFEPKFLLGLTATPERTDGADLLRLCGDNLVYRSDLAEGIRKGLLSPFDYYGVPDEVDYDNIPWRSRRFDEEALTTAVATQARAENALDQWQRHGGGRTIAFCVSQRHADFMAAFFRERGLKSVAVHAGSSSAPRAHSLERLEEGELDVVCAVDMFNEGVDIPQLETVLMLRPTESRILWQQQFGRGLRFVPGKKLRVIDYIGNHRIFLTKTRALLGLGNADREVAYALEQIEKGTLELPPNCSVTYELEAREILRSLLRSTTAGDQLERYYEDFREMHGSRPLAAEVFMDGFNPRATRRAGQGTWFDFVSAMGDLNGPHQEVRDRIGAFLEQLEITPMTRSYKMVVLQAMLAEDAFPGELSLDVLVRRFRELVRRHSVLRNEVGDAVDQEGKLRRLILNNPIAAWSGGAGTGDHSYFTWDGERFGTAFEVPERLREPAQVLVDEIVEWRLAEYVRRAGGDQGPDRFVCRVSQASGRPMLFLPDRDKHPGLPVDWRDVWADEELYQAKFVKVALNVVTSPGEERNVLPELLRGWFGPEAGQPGTSHWVAFERRGDGYRMRAVQDPVTEEEAGPQLWNRYTRDEAFQAVDVVPKGWDRQTGIVNRPDQLLLLVTLDKRDKAEAHQYEDRFLSATEFQWQSQNKNSRESELGRKIGSHQEKGVPVHLFVRKQAKRGGQTQPFLYAGRLEFQRWEGDRPITVWWKMEERVPEELWGELGVGR